VLKADRYLKLCNAEKGGVSKYILIKIALLTL
jgi:hypothetical protein